MPRVKRLYVGLVPQNGIEIKQFSQVTNKFLLYAFHPIQKNGWLNMKLIKLGKPSKKANYHIKFNGERFAVGGCFDALMEYETEIAIKLINFMKSNFDRIKNNSD